MSLCFYMFMSFSFVLSNEKILSSTSWTGEFAKTKEYKFFAKRRESFCGSSGGEKITQRVLHKKGSRYNNYKYLRDCKLGNRVYSVSEKTFFVSKNQIDCLYININRCAIYYHKNNISFNTIDKCINSSKYICQNKINFRKCEEEL